MIQRTISYIKSIAKEAIFKGLYKKIDKILYNQGILFAKRIEEEKVSSIQEVEFNVYSKSGEDGIIEYIFQEIESERYEDKFVEFGVQAYSKPNTRFLLEKRHWEGLVIDGSKESIRRIKNKDLYWENSLEAEQSFITRENINRILRSKGYKGEIGLLSIDIDGNDYWVWKKIEEVSPSVLVVEYNSVFGCNHPITIPYKESFSRESAHYSHLYFGASLPALDKISESKGYYLVGSNKNGDNAFFIKEGIDIGLEKKDAKEAWVESKFRESRGKGGKLNFVGGRDRVEEIEDKSVYHVGRDEIVPIKDLRPLY